ncbi:BTAD domain-containing protein [Deferrisoma camini]|uniref:BTAD domain-containing protein n=1 Tax=Deferrisoma camini TaxID=1035120 RepID=UPI00046D733D|nr:BTAD domain-containing protein [Deferrisoma camini]
MEARDLLPEFGDLAQEERWDEFAAQLARRGLVWWFEMDVPAIRRHMAALRPRRSPGLSPRLLLLEGAASPLPADRDLRQVLRDVTLLYRMFRVNRDAEGAAAACGLAIAALWDFGVDWSRSRPWADRIDRLAERKDLSPLARSSALAFRALMLLFHQGNLDQTLAALELQRQAAEEARSAAMTLYGATLQALALAYQGRTERAGVVLEETAPFLDRAPRTSYARLYHRIMLGIVLSTAGRPGKACETLRNVGVDLAPEDWRVSVRLLLQGARLLAASLARHEDEVPLLEASVRQLAVGEQVHFFAALMQFSVGLFYLGAGRPYRALVHAERGERAAARAESLPTQTMIRVLQALALADLNEKEEAAARLDEAMATCQDQGWVLFAEGAALDRAAILADRGETDEARKLLDGVRKLLPRGRPLLSAFRPPEFTQRLLDRLEIRTGPAGARWTIPDPDRPVQIRSLGGFSLTILGHTVYDRRWRSSRTQQLLKLLLALGGEKVPVDRLTELLWPDALGDQARANLKTALARLRVVGLPPGAEALRWLHWKHGRLSLSRSVVFADCLVFETAARAALRNRSAREMVRALELYQGDFLSGDGSHGVIESRREALRHLHVRLVEGVADRADRDGFRGDLNDLLSQAVAVNPMSERLYALKMKELIRRGYPVEALRTFRQAEAFFRDTLGIPPGPALRLLANKAKGGSD